MSENRGVAPPDPVTDTGRFRALSGDLEYQPLDPPIPGWGSYMRFSDAEIEAYLAQADGSVPRAIGYSYLYLAGQAAIASQSVRDYDLQVDTTKRAADLRAIAQFWFDKADEDDVAAAEEGFEIVPTGRTGGDFIPEGAVPEWGRRYTWAKWGG